MGLPAVMMTVGMRPIRTSVDGARKLERIEHSTYIKQRPRERSLSAVL
jgi:hypothetical protein